MTDSGSQKVQHYLDMISHIFDSRLLIIGITNENSSDLERVAATRSKSDEFSFVIPIIIELQRCENTTFHFHTATFGIRSP